MWLKFAVCGIRVGAKQQKTSTVFLKYAVNSDGGEEVNDASLAAFCLPLGPESQTPKDRMAEEVRMDAPRWAPGAPVAMWLHGP
jgi:hypothetical protein